MARKKLQKAFALLTAASMTMSLLSVTAFADEPETHEHDPITCPTCGGEKYQRESCQACGGSGEIKGESKPCEDCEGGYLLQWAGICPDCNGATSQGQDCIGGGNCIAGNIFKEVACETCGGTGTITETSPCEECKGEGSILTETPCATCDGKGTVPCTGTFVGTVTKAATCVAAGIKTYTCDTCGADYEEIIPVDEDAHQWGEPEAVEGKAPTCGAAGTGTRTCVLCQKEEEVVMPATGEHTYDEETLICTVCGAPEPADETTAAAIALLEALPAAENVAAEDQADIEAAREAYDALTDHQKKFVSKELLTRLTAAEEALVTALVTHADALLAAMPADPASDLWAVYSAYRAVSDLSADQKAHLTNTVALEQMETYMSGKDVFAYSVSGTDFMICAPTGKLEASNARFRAVTGSMDLDWIVGKLPAGCTVDAAYEMLNYYDIVNTVKALSDGQEVVMAFRSGLTQSLSKCSVYFVEGRFSSDKVSDAMPVQLQNGTLVITMTSDHGTDATRLPYVAFARSMEYTDGSYTTPSAAAHSYAPAARAASSAGITYDYSLDGSDRVVTVTIPAGYTGDTVSINMEAIREVFGELSLGFVENGQIVAGFESEDAEAVLEGKEPLVPGMDLTYRIEIVNLSGKDYTYRADSLWMDTAVLEGYIGYTDEACAYPTFDGTDHSFVVYRTWNRALSALLDSSETLNDETINAALREKYNNTDDIEVNLPHYYLDYYNFVYNTNAVTLEQLPDEAILNLFDGERDVDGTVFSRETLPELNNLAYNYFYTHGLQVDQSNFQATGYNTSAGAVMAGRSDSLEDKAADAWKDLDAATETPAVLEFTVTPSALLGNSYMRYPVACDMGFTLTEVTGGGSIDDGDDDNDPRPPHDDDDDDDDTNIPDENTPTTDLPDPETPTTELPEEETPTTDIPEEETPLAEVPETGDVSALWLALTALSGTGLAGVTFLGRKKREDQ